MHVNLLSTVLIPPLTSKVYAPSGINQAGRPSAEDGARFSIFSVVWAIATLFHMAQSRIYAVQFQYVLLTLAALALIAKPSSVVRLLVLIGVQLYEVFFKLPDVSNHWIFTTFVNLTILQALLFLVVKNKSLRVDKEELLRAFAPAIRIELLLLYFFVVLHKLNWDFFSTEASCAAVLYKAQHLDALVTTSNPILLFNIYLTIFIEALIPLFLIFRKTRNIGVLIGLCFHCIIAFNSYNGFYDFSAMVFAVYFLFTNTTFSNTLLSVSEKALALKATIKKQFADFSFQNVLLIGVLIVASLLAIKVFATIFQDHFQVLWGAYSISFILLFLLSFTNKTPQAQGVRNSFRLPSVVFLLFPVAVFLNGMSPYLGLKTETSFAMFSNLRTEGGVTNHFFIPISAQVFNFQKDMVEVVSSSDPGLQKLAAENKLLPFFKFKNYVATTRPAQVVYVRNGQQQAFTLATASPNDELIRKSSFILRKTMGFRAINKLGPQPCQH